MAKLLFPHTERPRARLCVLDPRRKLLCWCELVFSGLVALICICICPQAFGQPCGKPRITGQPQHQIVLAGDDAFFSVDVLDEGCALTYAWRYFGFNIQGGTDPTLSLYKVQPPPATKVGPYSVEVTDVSGSATSSVAYLTIVSGPLPWNVCATAGSDVTFSNLVYWFDGPGPPSYQWRFQDQDILGATNSTLCLTNVDSGATGPYSVLVTNPGGSVVTSNAWLRVEPPAPRLWGASWDTNGFTFKVTSWAPGPCSIQALQGWDPTNVWMDVASTNIPPGTTWKFIDSDALNYPQRFYRAVQQP